MSSTAMSGMILLTCMGSPLIVVEDLAEHAGHLLAEEDELDLRDRFPASAPASFDDDAVGRLGDVPGRPAVDSPTDGGERDRGGSDLLGEVEARFEAGFEELRIGLSRVPVRTDRVDDPRGVEVAGGRGQGLARRQAPHMSRLPDLATGL